MKSRLTEYLESNKIESGPDGLLKQIHEAVSDETVLDLIITYGSAMEKKGYDAGYEQGKKWPK